jgi:3-oxoacyl-[acyl-carrier protein] reductase
VTASARWPSSARRGCGSLTESLTGRVALVTGGSGGIGAAICRALAAHGAAVAVGYGAGAGPAEHLAVELRSHGARAVALGADLALPEGPDTLVSAAVEALGPVDILVANHGVATRVPWQEIDAATFDHTLAVNLRAPFLLARAVLPGMAQRGFGRVLFVSSTAAYRGGVIGPHYAASKAGLHGMTYYLAARVADRGVTVNAIAPGFIDTAMLPGASAELGARVPVGRVGRPEEVADLVLAVVRNGYLTSHVLPLDGGMHPG